MHPWVQLGGLASRDSLGGLLVATLKLGVASQACRGRGYAPSRQRESRRCRGHRLQAQQLCQCQSLHLSV